MRCGWVAHQQRELNRLEAVRRNMTVAAAALHEGGAVLALARHVDEQFRARQYYAALKVGRHGIPHVVAPEDPGSLCTQRERKRDRQTDRHKERRHTYMHMHGMGVHNTPFFVWVRLD
jgi:hypothetical protein